MRRREAAAVAHRQDGRVEEMGAAPPLASLGKQSRSRLAGSRVAGSWTGAAKSVAWWLLLARRRLAQPN